MFSLLHHKPLYTVDVTRLFHLCHCRKRNGHNVFFAKIFFVLYAGKYRRKGDEGGIAPEPEEEIVSRARNENRPSRVRP